MIDTTYVLYIMMLHSWGLHKIKKMSENKTMRKKSGNIEKDIVFSDSRPITKKATTWLVANMVGMTFRHEYYTDNRSQLDCLSTGYFHILFLLFTIVIQEKQELSKVICEFTIITCITCLFRL